MFEKRQAQGEMGTTGLSWEWWVLKAHIASATILKKTFDPNQSNFDLQLWQNIIWIEMIVLKFSKI